ncbi:MAG: hypothetical protein QOJ51_2418 [Acidobacteriaceae bacterium]|nr:hypothetical protein [Acidobacteriaceae bacterium]
MPVIANAGFPQFGQSISGTRLNRAIFRQDQNRENSDLSKLVNLASIGSFSQAARLTTSSRAALILVVSDLDKWESGLSTKGTASAVP